MIAVQFLISIANVKSTFFGFSCSASFTEKSELMFEEKRKLEKYTQVDFSCFPASIAKGEKWKLEKNYQKLESYAETREFKVNEIINWAEKKTLVESSVDVSRELGWWIIREDRRAVHRMSCREIWTEFSSLLWSFNNSQCARPFLTHLIVERWKLLIRLLNSLCIHLYNVKRDQ